MGGQHAPAFYALLRALSWLQGIRQTKPPVYILENTAAESAFKDGPPDHPVRQALQFIVSVLGQQVCIDAVALGAFTLLGIECLRLFKCGNRAARMNPQGSNGQI